MLQCTVQGVPIKMRIKRRLEYRLWKLMHGKCALKNIEGLMSFQKYSLTMVIGTHCTVSLLGHTVPQVYWDTLYHTFIGTHCTISLLGHTAPQVYWDTLYHKFIGTHCTTSFLGHTVP